ncbi:hypothetical protein [Xenorhabdus lircayensis]|uniref:Uncharacterized protein n=1 Tax=Xenorhabdus lircayensis TaxID=2763499 RepID=A0ABS0U3B4_9GAMM|nr:hypothetical protein [Xenorhabdus lircayensis]MBI6547230.1 hypothetical protein [Xenorhabdus lircayensis]
MISNKDESLDEVEYYGKVKILQLETYPKFEGTSTNNVEVTFKDQAENVYSNFYLVHPDGQIEGGGVYTTLLLALINNKVVTLKTNGFVGVHNERYITGVIIVSE